MLSLLFGSSASIDSPLIILFLNPQQPKFRYVLWRITTRPRMPIMSLHNKLHSFLALPIVGLYSPEFSATGCQTTPSPGLNWGGTLCLVGSAEIAGDSCELAYDQWWTSWPQLGVLSLCTERCNNVSLHHPITLKLTIGNLKHAKLFLCPNLNILYFSFIYLLLFIFLGQE